MTDQERAEIERFISDTHNSLMVLQRDTAKEYNKLTAQDIATRLDKASKLNQQLKKLQAKLKKEEQKR